MRLILPAAALSFQAACYVAASAVQASNLRDHRLIVALGALPEWKALPLPWPIF